eukprot:COSAG01_NODE_61702_length_288_cov_0.825397_2_plen_29_part_01
MDRQQYADGHAGDLQKSLVLIVEGLHVAV